MEVLEPLQRFSERRYTSNHLVYIILCRDKKVKCLLTVQQAEE